MPGQERKSARGQTPQAHRRRRGSARKPQDERLRRRAPRADRLARRPGLGERGARSGEGGPAGRTVTRPRATEGRESVKVIGVDLGGTKLAAGIVQDGRLLSSDRRQTDKRSTDAIVQQLVDTV